jgi:hypothetical protein
MVSDTQTVHHILKNTAVQNVNKPFVYTYGLDFHFKLSNNMYNLDDLNSRTDRL